MKVSNSQGKVYYGMHFYPGVAEYQEPGKDPFRVFLNEDTIRSMDPSFAGRPIFVEHVDEVDSNIDELRKEADGWVVESFYNAADGKHWAKFIIVSDRGERAIRSGLRLSNAYVPKSFGQGGLWNGVTYVKEITGGEYEHLAIVKNPRYEESVIMTPEEFKHYNEEKVVELKRLSNSKDKKGNEKMGLKLFKRAKVENSTDIEGIHVVLPKSGREVSITQLVNEMDEYEEKKNGEQMADPSHMVKMHDDSKMSVGDLVAKHKEMKDELEAMKKENEEMPDEEPGEKVDVESSPEMENEEDEEKEAKKNEEEETKDLEVEKKKNSLEAQKKQAAKEKADRLRNASRRNAVEDTQVIQFSGDAVARGKARYGSN